jgi:2-methylcitrate dehydratase PrpD
MTSLILRRKAGVREFTDEFVASAPVQQMMPRVTTIFDPKIEAQGFDKIRSIVEIDLNDGRMLVQASDDRYRGGPDRPFTPAELREKFTDCAQLTLGQARIARALEQIEHIDRLKDVAALTRTLTT